MRVFKITDETKINSAREYLSINLDSLHVDCEVCKWNNDPNREYICAECGGATHWAINDERVDEIITHLWSIFNR